MQVILLEKIKKLGDLGQQVQVKRGFARNYLLPKGKAVPATDDNKAYFEANRLELEKKYAQTLSVAKERSEQFEGLEISMTAQARDNGVLFGSITPGMVIKAFENKGLSVQKNEIEFIEPIKTTGNHQIRIRFHTDVEIELPLKIEAS